MAAEKPLTYRDAGVDIDEGDALVERIKPLARRTARPEVLAGIGGVRGGVSATPTSSPAGPVAATAAAPPPRNRALPPRPTPTPSPPPPCGSAHSPCCPSAA